MWHLQTFEVRGLSLPGRNKQAKVIMAHLYNRNEVLINTTTWMTLENIMLSEGSQSQKTTYYVIPYETHQLAKSIESESILVVASAE